MKPESGLEILEQVIQNFSVIRQLLLKVGYDEPITFDDDKKFLEAKGIIARKLPPLRQKSGNPNDIYGFILRFLRKIPSLIQLNQMNKADLKFLEKECHKLYIDLNRWYGEEQ